MATINVLAVVYAIRQYRRGHPTYLVLWASSFAYGVILEFTTGMLISRSYIQGEFTVMLMTGSIPGYKTDMPVYILLLYPAINFLGFKLVEAFGIRSILARAMSAGVITVLIDAPYGVTGPLPNVRWWRWLDWTIGGRHMFEYWYGWPITEAVWQMTWPPLLMWLVWQWERRRAATVFGVAAPVRTPLKTVVAVPLLIGLMVNTGGLLLSFPISLAIGFDLPHYPFALAIAALLVVVFLFSDKRPVGMDGMAWVLLGIYVLGYAVLAAASFAAQPVPGGQITLVAVALTTLVLLACYSGHAARRMPPESESHAGGSAPSVPASPDTGRAMS